MPGHCGYRSSSGTLQRSHTRLCQAVSSPQPLFAVRQANTTDIPVLAHHRVAMFRDMGELASRQEAALERATASYLRDALPRGEYVGWVAEDDGTPPAAIGGAGVQLRSILPRPRMGADDLELGPRRSSSTSMSSPPGGGAVSPKH